MLNFKEKLTKKGITNTQIGILFTTIIIAIAMVIVAVSLKITQVYNAKNVLTPENLKASTYTQITGEDAKVENCDYVLFSAFFTRDLNGDGNAEKLLGTCKEINELDQLYIDLNVLSNGYLENGKITINGQNFKYAMNMVKDNVLKNTYISNNVKEIELNKIEAGTQKLIIGNVIANLENNINNYTAGISQNDLNNVSNELKKHQVNTITLTGTHVADDGTKTEISKTIPVIIDWYGKAETNLYTQNKTYYYDNMENNTISINIKINEIYKQLILKENILNLSIPDLKGFAPTEVKCINSNVESKYDEETKVLSIKRESQIDEDGKVISSLSNSNTYTVEITYPQEAYDLLQNYTTITVPITGYYTCYNNQNEEFENPYKTNIAKDQVTVLFRDVPQGEIYNFYAYYDNKQYITEPYYKYVISKQNLINLYNKQELDEQTPNEKFIVKWIAVRGQTGEVPSMIMSETKQESEKYGDKFSDIVMDEYIVNTGIYFENADNMLGETGEIKIYNNDTNELIKTFTVKEWNTYTKQNPYTYEIPIKHIRVETSKANVNNILTVYNVKELQTLKFIQNYKLEQLKQMNTVYTYLTGICNIEGQESGTRNVLDYAEFIEEKSIATISVSKNQLETQETTKNQQITITARYNNIGDSKWKNANYIVEIPKEIINMEINDVTISNDNVQLVGYEIYKENEQYFIKIITQNANQESYTININCNMTPDPRKPTSHKSLKLYASNEWNSEYYYQAQDIYDINGNNDTEEIVGTNNTGLDLLSPTSLITLETVSNYNNKQEITIAPNVADVEKQTREATISMELTNNYTTVVSGVQILGKIPYKGNTYILNGNSMNSQFTTVMKNTGIQVPLELQEKTVVYYSTKENPDKDITNPANAWTLLENVEDFSEIKSYLINMKEYVLEKGKQYNFSYNVNIPEGIEYNMVSYSNHAVFYELDTDGGKLTISTEPNKVGIRIARKLDLEVIKNKFGMEKVVPGARYKLTQTNENGEEFASKICTTDANGKMIFKDLYINAKYVFKEIRESSNYSLNTDVIEFETNENASGELVINVTSQDKFKTVPIVTKDANGKDIVKTTVENEPRYNVEITKIDIATGEKLENVQFKILETGSIYRTDLNGKVTIEKLQQNVTYTLKEIKADGYYLPEDIQFKLIKDAQGKLKIESQNSNFANANIENTEENDLIKVSLRISNEKIPTYNLQVLKVEENADEQELDKLKTLQGAIFKFKYEDLGIEKIVTTNKDGSIDISDLYQYVDGKYITGKYTLQELQSPEGYANNGEKINFRVIKDAENNLQIEIEDKDNLNTVKNTIIDGNTVKLIVQNKPLFKIRKTDSDTGTPIANVKFVIYECNENYNPVDFAKDVNGNYVGKKDEKDRYVITTDEKGEITIPLREAKYKIEEIEQPEKYSQNNYWKFFEIGENKNSGVDEDGNIEIYELEKEYQDIVDNAEKGDNELEVALEIDSIEDLVKFSNDVNSGNTYENKMVKLIKTLDFEDDSSYENPNRKAFGDLNANGVVEGLKEELTNKNGCGFTPIGSSDGNLVNTFKGVFDGQKNEIRNLYINSKKYNVGLFGNATYKIKNVGITGEIIGKGYVSGIVASTNNTVSIINCYNKCDINVRNYCYAVAGIAVEGKIINCYNTGNIHGGEGGAGGIGSGVIINCYNTGTILSKIDSGGIIPNTNFGTVRNSYNLGDVISENYASGIGKNGNVKNCYNAGTITGKRAFGLGVNITCESSFNAGTITGKEDSGGISDSNSTYCYNTGDVISINGDASGIGAFATCCYNTGNITAAQSAYGISHNTAIICYNTGNVKGNDESAGISNSLVVNCYNTGNVTSSKKASGLGLRSDVINSYCLDTAKISAPEVISSPIVGGPEETASPIVSDEYMKSMEFVDVLNYNQIEYYESAWKYKNNQYPQLLINVVQVIKKVTELDITNTINKYKITTEIGLNSEKQRVGGNISGEYYGIYTQENNIKFVENVKHGYDNEKIIEIKADDDYKISEITINGENIEFTVDEIGNVIFGKGYFENVTEDKHVTVKFEKRDNLVIYKVDESDNNKKLKGAKFKIEYKDNIDSNTLNNLIGEIKSNPSESYTFRKNGTKYVSTNANNNNTCSRSYFPIDLTKYPGETFTLSVSYTISSESNSDMGYGIIDTSNSNPSYNKLNTDYFINVSGRKTSTKTTTLNGGSIYYLHIGYLKDSSSSGGNDTFTINSIKLMCNEITVKKEIETDENGIASIRVPNNKKVTVTEVEAPTNYEVNNESQDVIVNNKEIKELVFTNKKISKVVIVHHYLQGTGPEYNNDPVILAEDEILEGTINSEYTTEPKYDIKDYVLIKNENGEYMLPSNANGKFTEDEQHVYYYYNNNPEEYKSINSLTVKKQDNDGNNLEGATFSIVKDEPVPELGDIANGFTQIANEGLIYRVEAENTDIVQGDPTWRGDSTFSGTGVDYAYDLSFKFNMENGGEAILGITSSWSDRQVSIYIDGELFKNYNALANNISRNTQKIDIGFISEGEHTIRFYSQSQYAPIYDYFTIFGNSKPKDNCIKIDLTNYKSSYELSVLAKAGSSTTTFFDESIAYGKITNSTEVPSKSDIDGEFMKLMEIRNGDKRNSKKYTTELVGGNVYYLHLGTLHSDRGNKITFIVENIKLTPKNNESIEVTTDSTGKAIAELTQGDYIIEETVSPKGYKLSSKKTNVTINSEKDQTITILNEKIENEKETIINKIDKETNKPIPNAKFVVYSLDYKQNIIGFAKKYNGEYIGRKDENGNYLIETNENGQLKLELPVGYYKAVEVETAPGFELEENEELRTVYFAVGDIEINYIEDLIDLSNNVTNGSSYEDKIITLARNLDFNDDSSYRNPNDTTTYGDYNLDGQVEVIKTELTNENGIGFHPIGEAYNGNGSNEIFSGIFVGNGYEIKNLYIKGISSALFNTIYKGNISNLKLKNVNMNSNRNGSFGFAYKVVDSSINNCSIDGKITSAGGPATGIVGDLSYSIISNCYNTGTVTAYRPAVGIVYNIRNSTINNSYNTGTVTSNSSPASGIVGLNSYDSTINNCYNTGTITSNDSAAGGIVAYSVNNIAISNCYNTGIIIGNYEVAGIVPKIQNSSIKNCYNIGEVKGTNDSSNCGGIVEKSDNSSIENTYYLNTTATQGIYGQNDTSGITESKTIDEMQSKQFTQQLNSNAKNLTTGIKPAKWIYTKNETPKLDILSNTIQQNGLVLTNRKIRKVIVHHYLQGTGPEYNNDSVILAEDETLEGILNEDYTTSPKMDIPNYTLTKDQNGEYIIPSNASGNFTEDEQHVYYYYNVEPVKLTVHHYLEGTENKLAEDEKYFYQQGEHYKVTPSEEVLKIYDFVSVDGTEEKDITEDEVVTYYYKLKQYKITTKVEIPESELEAGRSEKGGTISGEDEQPYETVKHGENSQKPLILTPNAGYKVSSITINGNQVSFTVNPDGTVELAKFENMTEDKEIIVSFVPTIGKVITHHYIQGTTEKLHDDIINEDKLGETVKTEPVNIDNYKLVGSSGNKDIDGNVLITKEISEGVEEIIYYYQVCYKITTDVIEHTENYKDGTVKQKVKGGTITNEDVVIHEQVVKYEDNVKQIEIKPDNEYEIEEIFVNGRAYDFTSKLDANGNVILPAGTFTNVQENIHVQVKFRKKSKVIVKYLEEGKQTELAPETIIQGFDGKEFNTISELIPGYSLVKIPSSSDVGTDVIPKVTDENNNSTNPNGIMFSDDLTIIYWYTKPDANVIVRHIETNEKCEEIEIENELCKESVGANVSTNRKAYDKYISVDAPEETKEKIENNYENITIIEKDDNSKTVAVVDGKVIEVWYYYEKQYDITTEVKTHNETINGVETQVAGGTISKAYKLDEQGKEVEVTYEVVNSRGDSTKAIEMIPEDGYRIKTITVNDKEILINNISKDDLATLGIVKDGEKITLKEGYFKDVQNDFHVVVEFEKIPAKVIVKYLDAYTKESIIDDKVVEGYVYDKYNEQRVDIEGYIPAEPEPENSTGIMKIDPVTVVYYYTKQFKITTDVKEHLEDEVKSIVDVVVEKFEETITGSGTGNVTGGNGSSTGGAGNTTEGSGSSTGGTGNTVEGIEETTDSSKIPAGKILVKGGSITGEDETPYETVSRGETNTKQIEIIPNEGYRIKSLRIIDLGKEYNLSVESMINAKGTIILPSAYFTNMQSDKHIVVEFEPIPSKVIVNYLDIDTKEEETPTKVSKTENGNGYVNYDYKTHEKNVPFYELVKEELPKNAEGKLTKEDTIVNYWYKKLLFNMKLTKEFSSIKVNGEEVLKENNKFAKIDILNTKVADTNIIVKYKISVTNTEKVSGIATIIEQIPVGFKYVGTNENSENSTQQSNSIKTTEKWEKVNGKLQLTTKDLKPGETAEYEIELQWDKNMNCLGNLVNTAKITQTANIPNYGETTLEDNTDSCTIILAIKTGENRDVKTIISISCFILAGICTVIYVVTEVIARRKEKM